MAVRTLQNSFNGGEVSPAMYGRFDDQKYAMGAALMRNFIALPQGPAMTRPGFAYVNTAKYPDRPVRLIPFTFSSEQTMCLEFGDKYIRFHTQGRTLVKSDGTPYEIASPYSADDLFQIHYVQSADVVTLVHPGYAPRELKRYGASDWRLEEIDFSLGIGTPSGLTVSFTTGDEKAEHQDTYTIYYRVTAIKQTDMGLVESEPTNAVSIACNLYIENSYNTLSWGGVSGASRYRVYKTYSGVYGLLGETESTSYVDTNFDTDTSITPPRLDDVFGQSRGIRSVYVNAQGSGYDYSPNGVAQPVGVFKASAAYDVYTTPWVDSSVSMEMFRNFAWRKLSRTPSPQWGLAVSTMNGDYPSYPDSKALIEKAKSRMELVDASGPGTGATFEPIFEVAQRQYAEEVSTGGDGTGTRKYSETTVTLTGVRITGSGSGYRKPTLRAYSIIPGGFATTWGTGYPTRWDFEFEVSSSSGVNAYVTDSTGSGAELKPTVVDGKITSIAVVRPGSGYSNPSVVIVGSGSGARASASLGSVGDYPGAVTYYQQRRVFAGSWSKPRMLWMTASGTESNFTYTIPSQADNRVRFEIAAQDASRVLHVVPLSRLIVMTGATEFRVQASDGGAITSETISVEPQSSIGASEVQPIIVNSTLIYAANRGGHIRELGYNYQAAGFTTGDLSVRAAHLFENVTTVDMARMKTPDSIMWFVMSDGKLLGLTYLPEQGVAAWHQHTTDGSFESVCCIPEGQEDALYAVVQREVNGKVVRYIERMHERYYAKLEDAFYVDCGGTYKGKETTEITGLTWLEGKTVSILADGGVLPQTVVKDGKVKLDTPVTHAHIGLPIKAELKTLPVAYQAQDGSYGRGHMKNINKVFIRVYRSSGISVGPDENRLTPVKMRGEEAYGEPPQLISEEIPLAVNPKWTDGGQILVRQDNPLPLTVVSWTAEMAQ